MSESISHNYVFMYLNEVNTYKSASFLKLLTSSWESNSSVLALSKIKKLIS